MKIKVMCPKCKRGMFMATDFPEKARKQCVFCGNTFPVKNAIVKE